MTQPTSTLPPTTDTTVWPPPNWAPPSPPPAAPPAKRKIGRYIVGGVVLLFLVAGIAGSGDKKKDASSSGTVATTPTTTATPAATTAPTTRTTTNAAAAAHLSMGTWAERYGSPDSESIVADLNALMADTEAMDLAGMGSSCRTLQRHIATAESHLPTPDAQVTSALRAAYGYYDQAMTACISGTATSDIDDLTAMGTYIGQATGSLSQATARLKLLS